MKNRIFISLAISFLLFGCGGGGSSSSVDKPHTDIVASRSGTILVVDNMKKDVRLSSDRENARFEFVDKDNVPYGAELSRYTGLLVFRALGSIGDVDKVTVRAVDDSGWKSESLTLTFKTVSSDSATRKEYIKTGADDGSSGLERNFVKTDNGYIKDPFDNIWENNITGKSLENKIYLVAKNRCEIKRIRDKGSNWRVPTADEYLNLINYSKTTGAGMLDDTFDEANLTSWVEPENGKYFVVSETNGLLLEVKSYSKYPVRCINAPKKDISHIVSTDRYTDITRDFNTNLQWSYAGINSYRKIVDDINQTASEYCAEYDDGSGWRLPSINEVRSIVEDGTISTLIMSNSKVIISSTPYKSNDQKVKASNYIVGFNDGIVVGASPVDQKYPITCVKEIK
jgi:hypothetical protein